MAQYTSTSAFGDDYVNPRGIPKAQFINDIGAYVKERGVSVEQILRSFTELHSKYKLMEHKLNQNHGALMGKIPEITKTLDAIVYLKKKSEEDETMRTQFALTDLVFCDAEVPPQKTVHLWLGANTMVEYPLDDAHTLLSRNLSSAKANLAATEEDLAYLRDQQVVCEVNSSRLYNYEVVRKRESEEAAAAKKS
jgi:prefoldin subunit 5